MKRTVLRPPRSRSRARSITLRRSATPALAALTASNVAPLAPAMSTASVVLPLPGGPQRISDGTSPASTARRNTVPMPIARCWPTNSSKVRGRIRVACGACRAGSGASCVGRSGSAPKSELCPTTGGVRSAGGWGGDHGRRLQSRRVAQNAAEHLRRAEQTGRLGGDDQLGVGTLGELGQGVELEDRDQGRIRSGCLDRAVHRGDRLGAALSLED